MTTVLRGLMPVVGLLDEVGAGLLCIGRVGVGCGSCCCPCGGSLGMGSRVRRRGGVDGAACCEHVDEQEHAGYLSYGHTRLNYFCFYLGI